MNVTVLFITDPLCSWCWGTLPEVEGTRDALAGDVHFDLIMAGLQVGRREGLAEYNRQQLQRLWQEVHKVTGQQFSGEIPPDFIYHSEIACRAVEIARRQAGTPPWQFFHRLQRAFYVDGLDINSPDVLAGLLGLPRDEVAAMLLDSYYTMAARNNFELAKSLSANALPGVYLDTGEGNKLVCGGYVTAEQLTADLRERLSAA